MVRLVLKVFAASLTAGLLTLMLPPLHAGGERSVPRYSSVPAGADGIGKRYLGRDIAAVMGWQGAAWLEREERERKERTDLRVKVLALKPGMVASDIGAGTGYLARRMTPAVMPAGEILAVDVQPQTVAMLQAAIWQSGLTQIQPVLGAEGDVKLAADSVDLATMGDAYDELALRCELLTSVVQALTPGGQLVFVEYRAEDPRVPIKELHKIGEAQINREAAVHPLVWERTVGTLPWQHVVVVRQRG